MSMFENVGYTDAQERSYLLYWNTCLSMLVIMNHMFEHAGHIWKMREHADQMNAIS